LYKLEEVQKEFVKVCHTIGREVPGWTQGAGGNVSLKLKRRKEQQVLIKASGFRLDSVSQTMGAALLRLAPFVRELKSLKAKRDEAKYAHLIEKYWIKSEKSFRPSMESGFHALLPKKWVLHFHSIYAVLMADLYFENPKFILKFLARHKLRILFVDHLMPGLDLSLRFRSPPKADVIILRNHGLILQSDRNPISKSGILTRWKQLERAFMQTLDFTKPIPDLRSSCALKLYFPDSAVLIERILKILNKCSTASNVYVLKNKKDLDALELWRATQWLYALRPQLKELPVSITSKISKLPTEILRLQRKNP
jgi:hypothetical protein